MAEAEALAFNLSVRSDGLQGRSRAKCKLGRHCRGVEAQVCAVGPRRRGQVAVALNFAAGETERLCEPDYAADIGRGQTAEMISALTSVTLLNV